jgi:catechol 2,3-dioxygenase-like lactoylglutathione lyase family enzyme
VALSFDTLTIDCRDPKLVADFWCAVLGYRLVEIDEEGAEVKPGDGPGFALEFIVVPEGKSVKNRLHLDLRSSGSMADEVARVEAAGATSIRRVDEGGSFWTVMADPEGNEFCVLRGPEDGWNPDQL